MTDKAKDLATEEMATSWTYENCGGINLLTAGPPTPREVEAFKDTERKTRGYVLPAFEFWLDNDPDVQKRGLNIIPAWTRDMSPPGGTPLSAIAYISVYGFTGFIEGILYEIDIMEAFGHPKADVLEVIAFLYTYSMSRGFAEVAQTLIKRLKAYREPAKGAPRPIWPEGWAPNPELLKCGLDYGKPTLDAGEMKRLEAWYLKYMGEVPKSITFLAKHDPVMLKAWRRRFEATIGTAMPVQMLPWTMIVFETNRQFEEGIREAVLLARGLGLKRKEVINALMWGIEYSGAAIYSVVHRACDDVLDTLA